MIFVPRAPAGAVRFTWSGSWWVQIVRSSRWPWGIAWRPSQRMTRDFRGMKSTTPMRSVCPSCFTPTGRFAVDIVVPWDLGLLKLQSSYDLWGSLRTIFLYISKWFPEVPELLKYSRSLHETAPNSNRPSAIAPIIIIGVRKWQWCRFHPSKTLEAKSWSPDVPNSHWLVDRCFPTFNNQEVDDNVNPGWD